MTVSFPQLFPNTYVSSPSPPTKVSLPEPPLRVLSSSLPVIESLPEPPMTFSIESPEESVRTRFPAGSIVCCVVLDRSTVMPTAVWEKSSVSIPLPGPLFSMIVSLPSLLSGSKR